MSFGAYEEDSYLHQMNTPNSISHLACADYIEIPERFMKSAVEEYVKSCPKCFAVNPKVSCDAPPLNPIPVPARIRSLVGIDIIGPLQESSQGNKYIVAITDHFSKWTEAAALPQKTAARFSVYDGLQARLYGDTHQ